MEQWKEKLMKRFALTEEDATQLSSLGKLRRFSPGDHIVRMGELNDHIYILTKGIWREYCFHNGEEATIWFNVVGEITFSVLGYVSQKPSHLFIEAITESEAICISRKELEELYNTSITFANLGRRIIESLAIQYEYLHLEMWRKSALERYIALLEDYPEVVKNIPMKYIASYLGVTAQSLSRIRASLATTLL